MHQVLNMNGATFTAAPAGAFVQTGGGGFLVQPSNAGRQSRDSFVIIPEARAREILADLPIGRLWGVGKVSQQEMARWGSSWS